MIKKFPHCYGVEQKHGAWAMSVVYERILLWQIDEHVMRMRFYLRAQLLLFLFRSHFARFPGFIGNESAFLLIDKLFVSSISSGFSYCDPFRL